MFRDVLGFHECLLHQRITIKSPNLTNVFYIAALKHTLNDEVGVLFIIELIEADVPENAWIKIGFVGGRHIHEIRAKPLTLVACKPTAMKFSLEICAYSADSVFTAARCGAQRVELCSGRLEGGTTPSFGLLREALKVDGIGVYPILRPRGGDFCYTAREFEEMCRDTELMAEAGIPGIVTGILLPSGDFDMRRMTALKCIAPELQWCVHRAVDMCRNPLEALEELIAAGFVRVLSSGGKNTAGEGLEMLGQLQEQSAGRIEVMAGSGVHSGLIRPLWQIGIRHFHASASSMVPSAMQHRNPHIRMGKEGDLDEFARSTADAEKIDAMIRVLRELMEIEQ